MPDNNNSFPNEDFKKFLVKYLKLYVKAREPLRNSTTNSLKSSGAYFLNFLINFKTVEQKLQDHVTNTIADIKCATEWTDWYKLIFTLRKRAEAAQVLKTASGRSLLSETLHALASAIFVELKQIPPVGEENRLEKEIKSLKDNLIKLEDEKITDIETKQGNGVDDIITAQRQTLESLAYLCDKKSFKDANERNIFGIDIYSVATKPEAVEYKCQEKEVNYASPLVLQENFHLWLFEHTYQPQICISYSEFKKSCLVKKNVRDQVKQNDGKKSGKKEIVKSSSESSSSAKLFSGSGSESKKAANDQSKVEEVAKGQLRKSGP